MPTIEHSLAAVRRSYDWTIARISAHPAAAFWLIVAYLVIRR
jgi:hypothetical protein